MEGARYEGEMLLLMLPVLSWCLDSEINAPIGAGLRPAGLFLYLAMKTHHSLLGLAWKRTTLQGFGVLSSFLLTNFLLWKALQNQTCLSYSWEVLVEWWDRQV